MNRKEFLQSFFANYRKPILIALLAVGVYYFMPFVFSVWKKAWTSPEELIESMNFITTLSLFLIIACVIGSIIVLIASFLMKIFNRHVSHKWKFRLNYLLRFILNVVMVVWIINLIYKKDHIALSVLLIFGIVEWQKVRNNFRFLLRPSHNSVK